MRTEVGKLVVLLADRSSSTSLSSYSFSPCRSDSGSVPHINEKKRLINEQGFGLCWRLMDLFLIITQGRYLPLTVLRLSPSWASPIAWFRSLWSCQVNMLQTNTAVWRLCDECKGQCGAHFSFFPLWKRDHRVIGLEPDGTCEPSERVSRCSAIIISYWIGYWHYQTWVAMSTPLCHLFGSQFSPL